MSGYYHCSIKMIGRSNGRSAVACAAYRSGQTLHDERYGKTHDYAPRRGITQTAIIAPEGAPAWMNDREQLWNAVEKMEKRKDAQLAREVELGLPHQLSEKERAALVEEFIRQELTPRGMVADYAIHEPNRKGDERNAHAHIMTTLRSVENRGLSRLKDREACSNETIGRWREAWADIQNRAFERLQVRDDGGRIVRVDHRSYEKQGIDREPTHHMGVLATAMERHGIQTEIGDKNRAIMNANDNRVLLRHAAHNIRREAAALKLEIERGLERTQPRNNVSRDDFET